MKPLGMTGRRVPAWTIAISHYQHGEYVLIPADPSARRPALESGPLRRVHRLTPIWVQR